MSAIKKYQSISFSEFDLFHQCLIEIVNIRHYTTLFYKNNFLRSKDLTRNLVMNMALQSLS